MPHVNDRHLLATRRARSAADVRSRRPISQARVPAPRVDPRHEHSSTPSVPAREPAPAPGRGAIPDRGLGLLIIFTAGALVMVALVTLTAIIGRWWMLAPVMAVDFAVTGAMLAVVVRLLKN